MAQDCKIGNRSRTLATSTRHGAAVLAFFLASVQLATSDDIEASTEMSASDKQNDECTQRMRRCDNK